METEIKNIRIGAKFHLGGLLFSLKFLHTDGSAAIALTGAKRKDDGKYFSVPSDILVVPE